MTQPGVGRRLFREIVGPHSAPAMLFMHGGMGLDHTYFRPWLDPFARERRLVFYDHFGNGRSRDRTAPHRASTLYALAEDAEFLRASLQLDRFVLLGHSFGGCVALEYAVAYPDRVEALILCNVPASPAFADSLMAAVAAHGTAAQVELYQRAFCGAITTDEDFRDAWNAVVPLYFCRYRAEYRTAMDRLMTYSAEGFNRFAGDALPAYRPQLNAVQTPTLVLGGIGDIIVAPEHGSDALHRNIRGSQLHIFEQSGHFPFIEENERFLEVVSKWLGSIRRYSADNTRC